MDQIKRKTFSLSLLWKKFLKSVKSASDKEQQKRCNFDNANWPEFWSWDKWKWWVLDQELFLDEDKGNDN